MDFNWNSFIDNESYEDRKRKINENIEYIKNNPQVYLQRDKKGKGWICPVCGSGTGIKGTGMTEGKGEYKGLFTCWNCGETHDVIGWIKIRENYSSRWDAIKKAFYIYGLDY